MNAFGYFGYLVINIDLGGLVTLINTPSAKATRNRQNPSNTTVLYFSPAVSGLPAGLPQSGSGGSSAP
jgi:hypothetical protein